MPFKKGAFLCLEYTARVKETSEVFDTTQENIAKQERIFKEGELYEPKLVVLGEGWVLKALDEELLSLQMQKQKRIEIPPEKAFGSRDPEKLKMIPLRRLRDKGISPKPGARIEYDKKLATIRTVGAGRVQLDFNPPLAGKTLVYEVTPKKLLRTRKDKILALIHRRIPMANISSFNLNIGKQDVSIEVPEDAFYIEGLQLAKRGIVNDIQRTISSIVKVNFIESFLIIKRTETKQTSPKKNSKIRQKKKN